jgi:FixJ family two-component response regulator
LESIRQAIRQHMDSRHQDHLLAQARGQVARLTPRERDVLALIAQGRLNKQIARALGIAEKTVKIHRTHLMEKLQAESVAELVRLTELAGLQAAHQPPAYSP